MLVHLVIAAAALLLHAPPSAAAGATWAAPSEQAAAPASADIPATPPAANGLVAGEWGGSVQIVPFGGSAGSYSCISGCTVSTEATIFTTATSLVLDIAGVTKTPQCGVLQARYQISNVVPGAASGQFTGTLTEPVSGMSLRVCFLFSATSSGYSFVLLTDTTGHCPAASAKASCVPSTGGTVVQTWTGSFTQRALPAGLVLAGLISVAPFQADGKSCVSSCTTDTSTRISAPSPSRLSIDIYAGTFSPSCGIGAVHLDLANVIAYGPQFPGYYFGKTTFLGSPIDVCFYLAQSPSSLTYTFAIDLNSPASSCPAQATTTGTCTPDAAAVRLTWAAQNLYSQTGVTLPSGAFSGSVSMMPFDSTKGSCTTCTATASASMVWSGDSMAVYVLRQSSGSCTVDDQTLWIQHLARIGHNVYGGMLRVGIYDVPVCFTVGMDGSGFVLIIDLSKFAAACPSTTASPLCTNGASPGSYILTLTGRFTHNSNHITNTFSGVLDVVPYKQEAGQQTCFSCGPVAAPVTAAWSATGLSVTISAITDKSINCGVSAQVLRMTNVGAHPSSTTLFFGIYDEQPVCFYYETKAGGLTSFVLPTNQARQCPTPTATATCTNPVTKAGNVSQVLTAVMVKDAGYTDCYCSLKCQGTSQAYTSYYISTSCGNCTAETCKKDPHYLCPCGAADSCVLTTSCPQTTAFRVLYIVLIAVFGGIFLFVAGGFVIRGIRRRTSSGYTPIQ